jgi:hypothetical protein
MQSTRLIHHNGLEQEFAEAFARLFSPGVSWCGSDLDRCGGSAQAACLAMVWALWETLAANPRNRTPTLGIPFWIYLGGAAVGFGGGAILHLARLGRPLSEAKIVTAS